MFNYCNKLFHSLYPIDWKRKRNKYALLEFIQPCHEISMFPMHKINIKTDHILWLSKKAHKCTYLFHLPYMHIYSTCIHRLWSNFESGGAHNASKARTSVHCGPEGGERGHPPPTVWKSFLKSKTLKHAFSATLYQVFFKKIPSLLSLFPLMLPPTDNFLRMALPALVLGVLLAVCCYFGNLGNALLCESYYFSTTNYTNKRL